MINWKPIEKLTRDDFYPKVIFSSIHIKMMNYPIIQVLELIALKKGGGIVEKIWIHEDIFNLEKLKESEYTHYALLTPPQTNQS